MSSILCPPFVFCGDHDHFHVSHKAVAGASFNTGAPFWYLDLSFTSYHPIRINTSSPTITSVGTSTCSRVTIKLPPLITINGLLPPPQMTDPEFRSCLQPVPGKQITPGHFRLRCSSIWRLQQNILNLLTGFSHPAACQPAKLLETGNQLTEPVLWATV